MTTSSALKSVATGKPSTAVAKPTTIAGFLETYKSEIARALPKHMTADRMARIALTEVRKVPKLAKCDPATLFGAVIQCSQLGLEPGGALGHAYLLPFENRAKGTVDVQLIVGYRGMIDLARRSGQIVSIESRAVFAKDKFNVRFGLNSDLTHEPAWDDDDRGQLVFVYAVAKLKDGGVQFDVMSRKDVDRVRAQSKSGNNGPWVTHYEEMAKKTVLRRLFKVLPVSIELQTAVGLDEQSDVGTQDNGAVIDGAFSAADTDEPAATDPPPTWTYAQVDAALNKAFTPDELATAADMINGVADEAQRAELTATYKRLAGEK